MRRQLRLDEAGEEPTAAEPAEPMVTSADPSPDSETAPSSSPPAETAASPDGGASSERSTSGDTTRDAPQLALDAGADGVPRARAVDNAPPPGQPAPGAAPDRTDNETRTAQLIDNKAGVDAEGNTESRTGSSAGAITTDDASNANVLPLSPDENANTPSAASPPASSATALTETASDVTSPASDVTLAASDVTLAASDVTAGVSSPSRAALAARRRVIRRRALGEDGGVVGAQSEPVLFDQIGGEVSARRGGEGGER